MSSESVGPSIIAHRGASKFAPENTLAAIRLAIRQEADAVELDAKLTKDGHIVLHHDKTLDRTTTGSGRLSDHRLDELKALDAGIWFGNQFKNEPIPSLDEVFEDVGDQIRINIELTNYATPFDDLAEKVALLIKRHQKEDEVFFSSFNPRNLRIMKRIFPEAITGFLVATGMSKNWFLDLVRYFFPYQNLHLHHSDVSPQSIRSAHKRDLGAITYTVNLEQEIRRVFDSGVDGIFTDDIPLARAVREQFLSEQISGAVRNHG